MRYNATARVPRTLCFLYWYEVGIRQNWCSTSMFDSKN